MRSEPAFLGCNPKSYKSLIHSRLACFGTKMSLVRDRMSTLSIIQSPRPFFQISCYCCLRMGNDHSKVLTKFQDLDSLWNTLDTAASEADFRTLIPMARQLTGR